MDLRHCPNCGYEDGLKVSHTGESAYCRDCGMRGPASDQSGAAWNDLPRGGGERITELDQQLAAANARAEDPGGLLQEQFERAIKQRDQARAAVAELVGMLLDNKQTAHALLQSEKLGHRTLSGPARTALHVIMRQSQTAITKHGGEGGYGD